MAEIAFFAVNEEMMLYAKKIVKDMNIEAEMKIVSSDSVLQEANRSAQNGANVIIARGIHALIIKNNTKIPLVEIVLTGQDIAKLIHQAREIIKKPVPVIGLVGFKNMFTDTKSFEEIFRVTINEYMVSAVENLTNAVEKAAADKVDLVIGGEIANRYAEKLGIPSLFLTSGEDSIKEAFRVAEKVNYAIRLEKKNSAEFNTILDYSFDGIIKLNSNGMIVVFNYVAEKTFRKSAEQVLGKHISEVIDLLDEDLVKSVLQEGKELQSTFLRKGNLSLVANIAPIIVDNKNEGAILSFQEFKKIEEMEAEIRKEVYSKGYIAKGTFKQIIGDSNAMSEMKRLAKLYANNDSPIMITGEPGTGKKLFAESIHNESLRRNNPFVMVDCASMPPELLEKKLYGYMEGSYMHSSSPEKKGFIEIAHTGTLFLDKITELDSYGQLSLLRTMRNGNIVRIGDSRALPVNIRIICSANKNIVNLVREGKYNQDLYYMLNVLSLNIPPLRARKEDIKTLFDYYVEYYNNMYRKYVTLTDEANEAILSYSWPGNVQQLKNFCEKIIIMAPQKVLDREFINRCMEDYEPFLDDAVVNVFESDKKNLLYKNPEATKILELLEIYNGNRTKVAEELKMSKATLWRRMKKYNIESKFGY